MQPAPKILTAVQDRGRRGNPLPGCDCVQCFGYCLIDADVANRAVIERSERYAKKLEVQNDA